MKNIVTRILSFFAALALLTAAAGCGRHGPTSRMTVGSSHGRQLTVVIEGRASFATQGKDHIITFGRHQLVVNDGWLKVDGDKGRYGIPARARKVEIKIAQGILTMFADGNSLIKTPI